MEDIAPELLKKIQLDFNSAIEKSDVLKDITKKIKDRTATYIEANDYAIEIGNILSKVYKDNISSDTLPYGKMYYNIANRIIPPTMQKNYEVISKVSMQIQESLNEAAGIGINAVKPELNTDKIDGIVNKISNADNYDDVAWVLDDPIITFSQSIVDDSIKVNSEFQGKAGLSPKIVRKLSGGCCEWCREIAGVYLYPEIPDDVYRRHQRCRCTVEYDPGTGKRQNVHTKAWYKQEKDDIINERKILGLFANNVQIRGISNHVITRMNERYVGVDDIVDAIKNPLDVKPTKIDEKGRKSFEQIGEKATIAINPETGVLITVHKTHTRIVNKLKRLNYENKFKPK